MKKIVLEIIHENWGLKGPGSLESTIYKIYDDLYLDIKDKYNMIEVFPIIPQEYSEIKDKTVARIIATHNG